MFNVHGEKIYLIIQLLLKYYGSHTALVQLSNI